MLVSQSRAILAAVGRTGAQEGDSLMSSIFRKWEILKRVHRLWVGSKMANGLNWGSWEKYLRQPHLVSATLACQFCCFYLDFPQGWPEDTNSHHKQHTKGNVVWLTSGVRDETGNQTDGASSSKSQEFQWDQVKEQKSRTSQTEA